MKLRLFIGILFLFTGHFALADNQAEIEKAKKAYMAGFYENSISIYEKIIAEGSASPDLYYNLGNAYFKTNELPSAILNYERALKYKPGDEDILFNLGVANSRIVDKIDILPELFYIRWWKSLKTWLSPDQWAFAGIASFSLLFVLAALFLLSRSISGRKIFFSLGIILLIFNIISGIIAWQTYTESHEQNAAIVFTTTLPVKSSPDESSIDLFVIHEGLKVKIIDKIGDWNEIRIANGSKGWVKAEDIRPV
jgi:tetratricopeptide (TPR) repeat protein